MTRTTKTAVHEIPVDRAAISLLLYVRTANDLVCVCRQLEHFLALCRVRHGDSFATGRLWGAWIGAHTVMELPREPTLRLPTNKAIVLPVLKSFSLWGVWSVASIEALCLETNAAIELSHDLLLDALLATTRGDPGRVGRYSPAFGIGTSKKRVRTEIKRLNTRYPLRVGRPIYYDPATGGLSLDEESSQVVRMEKHSHLSEPITPQ